jgi:hypothetical protein
VFNRFFLESFLHEALMSWGYAAHRCIIDNTNLARLCGSSAQAVNVPEMVTFAQRYGFVFLCHALRHANRKAGEERSFLIAAQPGQRLAVGDGFPKFGVSLGSFATDSPKADNPLGPGFSLTSFPP